MNLHRDPLGISRIALVFLTGVPLFFFANTDSECKILLRDLSLFS